jgi:hypothetical protein
VYFLECKTRVSGCSAHPTVAENKMIADSVVATIEKITGWDTMGVPTGAIKGRPLADAKACFRIARINNYHIGIFAEPRFAYHEIAVFRADGRIAQRLRLNRSGTCDWNMTHATRGLYILGGSETGWVKVVVD